MTMAPPGRGGVSNAQKPRKKRRQEERAAKKQRKAEYQSRHKQLKREAVGTVRKRPTGAAAAQPLPRGSSRATKSKGVERGVAAKRSLQLNKANEREKKEITRLEKLLKLDKKKHMPECFRQDGLDYLLDLTDKTSSEWDLSEEEEEVDMCASDEGEADSGPDEVCYGVGGVATALSSDGRGRPSSGGVVGSGGGKGILHTGTGGDEGETRRTKKRVSFQLEGLENTGDSDSNERTAEAEVREVTASEVLTKRNTMTTRSRRGSSQKEEFQELDESFFETESIESEDEGVKEEVGKEEEEDSDGYLESSEEESPDDVMESLDDVMEQGETPASVSDVAANSAPATYIPPHLREDTKTQRLKKRVQGLLNRLSESNMKTISSEMEQLYRENSRNDMNHTLWEVMCKLCVRPVLITDRFSLEQTMLVAILHHRVGTEVGAHVVQSLVVKLAGLLEVEEGGGGSGKERECLVLLLAHLYNYRVIHCLLIYDLIKRLVESFREKDVELLLLLLKNAGLEIRRDDSKSLKDIILQIRSKAADSVLSKTPRMTFMLDTISALRTNNARKIPNYDPSLIEHMKKLLRGLLKTSGSLDEAQLKVSLQDLLNADSQGRWWVVGSAWTGRDTNATSSSSQAAGDMGVASESWVLELARKQRMNTDIRKKVFSVIMTSEDYVDGFEKLVRLGLKEVQEREVVHVLVDCCLQERAYNPYYAYLAHKLCQFNKSHQVTFQYSLWDRFKSLNSLTSSNLTNLRELCLHLISKKALSLSILKVVEFSELDKHGVSFFKRLLKSLISEPSEAVVREVFARIAPLPHLKKLRDGLLVFIMHYISEEVRGGGEEGGEGTISQRIQMVEHILRAGEEPVI